MGVKHTVVEAEIMLDPLTDKLKEDYKKISKLNSGEKSDIAWFDSMPKYKQDIVKNSASQIAKGENVIPTQLLSDLPGLKNAYQKVTAIISEGMDKPKILSETLHCGTPATKIKSVNEEVQQELVNENIKQLQSFLKPGEKLNLNILTSETPFNARGEDFVAKQLEQTKSKDSKVTISKSPINRWRFLGGGRNTKQFEKDLGLIGGVISESHPNLAEYLQKGQSRLDNFLETISFGFYKGKIKSNAEKELKSFNIDNKTLLKDLKVAFDTRNLVDSTTLFAPSENVNLEVTAKMAILRHSLKHEEGSLYKMASEDKRDEFGEGVNFCKSGKDRTGYVNSTETMLAVAHYLDIDPNSELGQKNFYTQIAAGHTQEMAGIQGGTIGCHGVKTNLEFGFNRSDKEIIGILDQISSHFNSEIKLPKYNKKDKAKKALQDKKSIKIENEKICENKDIKKVSEPINIKPTSTPARLKKGSHTR